MTAELLKDLNSDCLQHGYGRKKWWADQLQVPPLTISHWLSKRQKPNGKNTLLIQNLLKNIENQKQTSHWVEALWDCYYSKQEAPPKFMGLVILEILSTPLLDSRTLALLSWFVEKQKLIFDVPQTDVLRNRLGWLLEISGIKSNFLPHHFSKPQPLLAFAEQSKALKKYLLSLQTPTGKKWQVFDCSLSSIKDSLL